MLLTWLRNRRRRKIAAAPFPAGWDDILERNVPLLKGLTDEERQWHRTLVAILVAEKYWEGCRGLEITDEIRVTIAGHACFLLLGFENYVFDRLQSVLVYPDAYIVREKNYALGFEIEQDSPRLGEAWAQGPVILSWASVQEEACNPSSAHNVVLHEFAHVLDMQDHLADGTPPLDSSEDYRTWNEVMGSEFERLVDDAESGRATLLDTYGAVNRAEFFAVATECFFQRSRSLQSRHPSLYEVLSAFYRQDPAARG